MLANQHANYSTWGLKQAELESSMMNSIKQNIYIYNELRVPVEHASTLAKYGQIQLPLFLQLKRNLKGRDFSTHQRFCMEFRSPGSSWRMTMLSTFRSPTSPRILVQCPAKFWSVRAEALGKLNSSKLYRNL